MLKPKYYFSCLVIASLYLSCEKGESYDVQGEVAVKFYTNNEAPGNAPPNSKNYNAVNIPNTSGSGLVNLSSTVPAIVQFPVFATKPVSDDVTIAAQLDNGFVAAYNAANNTSYLPFPDNFFSNPLSLTAQILKGTTRSVDSISLVVNSNLLNTLTGTAYMAPIRLTMASKPEVGQITNSDTRITYVVLNLEQRLIRYNATAAQALGSLISPRTSWTVVYNPIPTTLGNIFDGSTTTFSRWANGTSPGQIDVNIQTLRNVTGIRLHTSTSMTTSPTRAEVYLSEDGVNWNHVGTPLQANLTYSTYTYILFYKAIPAKYIRLVLYYSTSTNTQNLRVTEFDVYAN